MTDPGDQERARLERDLRELAARYMDGERERFDLKLEIDRLRGRIRDIKAPHSYRLAGPLRAIERLIASLRKRGFGENLHRVRAAWRGEPPRADAAPPIAREARYADWIAANDHLTDADRAAIAARVAAMPRRPLLSVLMPVHDPPERFLRAAIESVRAQLYPDWELCIADDASRAPHVRAILEQAARDDPRVRVVHRPTRGGIAVASNTALDLARGGFAALLDHDDELAPHALYLVADALIERPDLRLIYSDEDLIDESGARSEPHFKSDWNPDLLLGQNCISHLGCFSVAMLRELGGFRAGYEGSQDWDLALRVAARARPDQIRHLPFVLYHWRRSTAGDNFSSRHIAVAAESARRAVRDALSGQGHDCAVAPIGVSSFLRVHWPLPKPPRVSVIVPTRDRLDLLRRCIDGLRARTDYPDLEILIVDNDSRERRTQTYLAALAADGTARILRHPGPFNFSAINNQAAAQARGEVLLFLNNDVEPMDRGWLREMAAHATRPEIGAVGALLRYPHGSVQHGGVFVCAAGPFGAHHLHPRSSRGVYGRLALAQNFSAVTAACMAMRKSVFEQVGGFNTDLAVNFNDVDLCLRLRAAGYRVVWTPFAELTHDASATRGRDDALARRELALLRRVWGAALDEDPFHNPNLAPDGDGFALAAAPRVAKPWR